MCLLCRHLPLEADFSRYLQQQADATGYQFHLLDLDGHTLYRTEDRDEPAISINATFPLQADGDAFAACYAIYLH